MPLVLDGSGNISTPNGDSGTYYWPDVVGLGSPKMTAYANGSYRWEGVLETNGTSTLNILEKNINLHGSGQIRALENSVINFGEKITNADGTTSYGKGCHIDVSRLAASADASVAAITYSNSFDRSGTTSRVNLYGSRVYLQAASGQRVVIFISNAADSVVALSAAFSNSDAICYFQINGSAIDTLFERCTIEYNGAIAAFAGCKSYNSYSAINIYTSITDRFVIENLAPKGATLSYLLNEISRVVFVDSPNIDLASAQIAPFGGTIQAESYKGFRHSIRILSGGSPVSGALVRYSGFETHTRTSDASGDIAPIVLVSQRTNVAGLSGRYPPIPLVDVSSYLREIKSYLHEGIEEPVAVDSALGTPSQPFVYGLVIDSGVTQTNTTTVAAYAGITEAASTFTLSGTLSLSQVFDRRKLFWRNNLGVPTPAKVGDRAVFGANITISAPANNPPATTKFDEAETTGSLTLSAAGNYSATKWIRGSGTTTKVAAGTTNFAGWEFVGTTIDNASASAAIVFVDADQVSNITTTSTGGGSISVLPVPGILSVFGFQPGSDVVISQAGRTLTRLNDTSPPFTWEVAGVAIPSNVGLTVFRPGYETYTQSVSLTASDQAITVAQVPENSSDSYDATELKFKSLMIANAGFKRILAGGTGTLEDDAWNCRLANFESATVKASWNLLVAQTVPTNLEITAWQGFLTNSGYAKVSFSSTGELS